MKDITKLAMEIYVGNMPKIKFWITTKKENEKSLELAKFLGFKKEKKLLYSDTSIIMIK